MARPGGCCSVPGSLVGGQQLAAYPSAQCRVQASVNIFTAVWMRGQSVLCKFAGNTELGGVVDMPEGCAGSSKRHVECLILHLKICGNANRKVLLSDYEKEDVFYLQHAKMEIYKLKKG